MDQDILEGYINHMEILESLETFHLGIQVDTDQEGAAIWKDGTLLGLDTMEDPVETHQVVMEDLAGLEEEEGVRMPGTLALITTSHHGVDSSNTLLLPLVDKDCLDLDRTQPQDLKTIMEHPIRLAGVLTILAKHHNQHMDLKEVHGTKITNLLVTTQEVDYLILPMAR